MGNKYIAIVTLWILLLYIINAIFSSLSISFFNMINLNIFLIFSFQVIHIAKEVTLELIGYALESPLFYGLKFHIRINDNSQAVIKTTKTIIIRESQQFYPI